MQALLDDLQIALLDRMRSIPGGESLVRGTHQVIVSSIETDSCVLQLRLADASTQAQLEERLGNTFVAALDDIHFTFLLCAKAVKVVCKSIIMMPCHVPGKLLECLLQLWCKTKERVMQVRTPHRPAPPLPRPKPGLLR